MSALHMIMQKWKSESVFRDNEDIDPDHVQLRIVMLGKLCGAVIGENGVTINEIKAATETEIRVQASHTWPLL
jgi:ribosomal protein S3